MLTYMCLCTYMSTYMAHICNIYELYIMKIYEHICFIDEQYMQTYMQHI